MKRLITLSLIIIATSCGVSHKSSKSLPQERIVVGISRSGISGLTVECFKKAVKDAGADCYFFPEYAVNDSLLKEYLGRCDALIVPGKSSKDTVNRKYYDDRTIKAAVAAGKPVLGICFGHQRICHVYGASINRITDHYPESKVSHKTLAKDGTNIGLHREDHPIEIDTSSVLYHLMGTGSVMVNTSHYFSVMGVKAPLKVVAVAEDGVVEAVEGDNIMGVQFHPEYLYGEMGLERFLSIFTNLVEEARQVKNR